MFISVTHVIAAKGGQGKGRGQGRKPEDRGKSRVIIDNIVGLRRTIPVAWKFPEIPKVSGDGVTFEKGDAIYRNFDMSGITQWIDIILFAKPIEKMILKKTIERFRKMGHAGLYNYWEPDELNKPEIRASHKTIESLAEGPSHNDFQTFLDTKDFWGVRTSDQLDAKDRRDIIDAAKDQVDPEIDYDFFEGYRSPGVSFRCDGLVEWCYETVGIDIVPDPDWWCVKKGRNLLAPNIQFRNLQEQNKAKFSTLTFGKEDEQGQKIYGPIEIDGEEIEPEEDGKYNVHGEEVEVKIYANDIDDDSDGSGIARLELWVGEQDDTPDEMPGLRLLRDNTDYPADNDYAYTWDTTEKDDHGEPLFPNGDYTLKAIAFDQAGNTKETYINVKIEELPYYFHVQLSPEYVETGSPVSQTETFTITVQCYNYGTSVNPPPEGMVNKLSGTESYVKNDDDEWRKEKINPDCTVPEEWEKSDYAGEVSFGIANIINSAYELYAGGEKLETLELADGAGTISGAVIKAEDGDIGDNHLFLIISASDGAGDGNGALMVNPIVIGGYVTDYKQKRMSKYSGHPDDWSEGWFNDEWSRALNGWYQGDYWCSGWAEASWGTGGYPTAFRFWGGINYGYGVMLELIWAAKYNMVYNLSEGAIGYASNEIEKAWMMVDVMEFLISGAKEYAGSVENITTGEVGTLKTIDDSHRYIVWQSIPVSDFGSSFRKYELEPSINTEGVIGAGQLKPAYGTYEGNHSITRKGIELSGTPQILFIPKTEE